jgi:hypothetical protein
MLPIPEVNVWADFRALLGWADEGVRPYVSLQRRDLLAALGLNLNVDVD